MPDKWPRDLWLDALWEAEDLKPNERVVAYVYGRYAFERHTAWCPWAELMRRTGIRSRDAINRALRGLESAGWLAVVQRPAQHRSAVYRLTYPLQQSVSRTPDASSTPDGRLSAENGPAVRFPTSSSPFPDASSTSGGPKNSQENSNRKLTSFRRSRSANDPTPPDGRRVAVAVIDHECRNGWVLKAPGCLEPCSHCNPIAEEATA